MRNTIIQGDCLTVLKTIPDNSIDCCVTSPPYWGLRDYGTATWEGGEEGCSHKRDSKHSDSCTTGQRNLEGAIGDGIYKDICKRCGAKRIDQQLGLEKTPEEYVANMVAVFREVKRVLKKEGTLWLNLGDSYAGSGKGWGGGSISEKSGHTQKMGGDDGVLAPNSGVIPLGLKAKDLVGIPWRVAFALQADGWYLRQDIIWSKPNPMPESVTDRCTKSHEYIFLMAKSKKYYFDNKAIREKAVWDLDGTGTDARKDRQIEGMKSSPTEMKNGIRPRKFGATKQDGTFRQDVGNTYEDTGYRNKRSVWEINTKPFSGAHFATFPHDLIEPMIAAGCPEGGIVLDPFFGSGTTGRVARDMGRSYIGIELNPEYVKIAEERLSQQNLF